MSDGKIYPLPHGEANQQQSSTLRMGAQVWSGTHKGVIIEVKVHPAGIGPQRALDLGLSVNPWTQDYWAWCYYIWLRAWQVPQRLYHETFGAKQPYRFPKDHEHESPSLYYHRREPGWIADLPWWGGCTYFKIHGGLLGEPMYMKAGCDFSHLWDQERGYDYSLAFVERECRSTVDAMLEAHPDLAELVRPKEKAEA